MKLKKFLQNCDAKVVDIYVSNKSKYGYLSTGRQTERSIYKQVSNEDFEKEVIRWEVVHQNNLARLKIYI